MNQLRLFFTQIQVANITPTMMHIIHTFLDRFLSNSYVLTLFNKPHITLLAWAGISSSYHRKYPHPPRAYKIKEKNWIINKVILYYIGQKNEFDLPLKFCNKGTYVQDWIASMRSSFPQQSHIDIVLSQLKKKKSMKKINSTLELND